MATTSQTYSIPTSTLASGSSTPTNSNGGGYTISDLFSSGGSPPIIVTFLAIGLFFVAMIGVFGWRRFTQSRGQNFQPTVRTRHTSIVLGKRPTFWDVWTDYEIRIKSPIEMMRWDDGMPMAGIVTLIVACAQPLVAPLPANESVNTSRHACLRILRCWVSAVRRFFFPEPRLQLPSVESDKNEVIPLSPTTSDEIEWGDASSVQVSVIIAMPTAGRESDMNSERMQLGEFCIGTVDVPWG